MNPLDICNKVVSSLPVDLKVLALTGSRAYGLSTAESDWDLVGIHFMRKEDFLQHPDFRSNLDVVRKQYDLECNEVFDRRSEVSLDSFEWWKFITLWLKGSIVAYELLHSSWAYNNTASVPELSEALLLMEANCSNKIGHAARGMTMHDWGKHRNDRKKCMMAYYRLLQALKFLQTCQFEQNMFQLKKWYGGTHGSLSMLTDLLESYSDMQVRDKPLGHKEMMAAAAEISDLVLQVERAGISTKLPDRINKKVLESLLQKSRLIRMVLINN